MKHVIIGGDGFVGSRLAADLSAAMGEEVLVCRHPEERSMPHYATRSPSCAMDVTKADERRDAIAALA